MEADVFEQIAESIRTNQPISLVTIIKNTGSSPGKEGSIMAVWGDGQTKGTVGGGNLEHRAIKEAISAMHSGKNRNLTFSLDNKSELGMSCGGEVQLYIKLFGSRPRLLIVGAGHIGLELYKIALTQGFSVIVIDDRVEFASTIRFPQAEAVIAENITKTLKNYPIDKDCYIAIATRSHESDKLALEAVVQSDAAYIGMIGSTNKINTTFKYLKGEGVSKETLSKVYAPMGLNIASIKPEEIALSIISEMMMVKNGGTLEHMRGVKGIEIL